MGVICILLLVNLELTGDKLNGGDEGSEQNGSKNRTLRNACFELGCGGDILTKFHVLDLTAGTPDRMQALVSRSFGMVCLVKRPTLLYTTDRGSPKRQPQHHMRACGAQRLTPNVRPMATLVASLSSRSPQELTEMSFIYNLFINLTF